MINLAGLKRKIVDTLHMEGSSSFDRSIMHPEREWFIGVFTGILLLSGGLYWSVTTYKQFSTISVTEIEGESKEELVYKEELVKAALEDVAARQAVYSELKRKLLERGSTITPVIPVVPPSELEGSVTEEEESTEETEAEEVPVQEESVPVEEGDEEGVPDIAI